MCNPTIILENPTAAVCACKSCGTPTHGSVGAAGYYWRFLCQQCKDRADGVAAVRTAVVGAALGRLFGNSGAA